MLPILRLALPAALAIIVLGPAAGVALSGRDLQDPQFFITSTVVESPIAQLVLRTSTLAIVLLATSAIVVRMLQRQGPSLQPLALAMLAAFATFFCTNVVVPGLFGHLPGLEKGYFYVLIVFIGLFASRAETGTLLDAVKWSILLFLVLSVAYAVVRPDAALRTYAPELRLPLVPFRFWGLSAGPNLLAPLALTLLLIAVARPFSSRLWQRFAVLAAIAVILVAQSQTTWIASAIIVPALLYFRHRQRRFGHMRVTAPPGLVLASFGLAAGAAVLAVAIGLAGSAVESVVPTPSLSGGSDLLTGRGRIWRVALSTFAAYPLFGYGLSAWSAEFRDMIGISAAFHAHNQLLQSLSVAGVVGGVGLVVYAATLLVCSFRTATATNGLAPALLVLAAIGSVSETPFDLATPLVGDTLRHALLFAVVVGAAGRRAPEPRPAVGRGRQGLSQRPATRRPVHRPRFS